jgi:hypothetical protein
VSGVQTGSLSVRSTEGFSKPMVSPSEDRQAGMSTAEPAGSAAGSMVHVQLAKKDSGPMGVLFPCVTKALFSVTTALWTACAAESRLR